MNNKLLKSDIKLIADKFEWSEKVAKSAIKEFLETPSFANSEEILRICIDADNPEDRKNNVFENLFNTHYDNLVELVCNQIVNTDPCFDILAAFNSTELKNLSGVFKTIANQVLNEASFLQRMPVRTYNPNNYLAPYVTNVLLCYEYLDRLLRIKYQEFDSDSLLLDIVSRVGFRAFNIDFLKYKAASYSSLPFYNQKANRLARAIASPLDKKEITQRGYWLTYVIIEKIREEYGLRGAFRKLAELTDDKFDSIQPRYFGRKKIAKKEGLTLDDIIIQYSLQKSILEIEQKLQEMSVNLSVTER
jgi:hypothetical protein